MGNKQHCPYYKNGYCTSPLLPEPDDTVTSTFRCLGVYKSCRFYVDNGGNEENKGLQTFTEEKRERAPLFYAAISLMEKPITSECQYFKLYRTDKGYVGYCDVLKRVLPSSQAILCSQKPNGCPFRLLNP